LTPAKCLYTSTEREKWQYRAVRVIGLLLIGAAACGGGGGSGDDGSDGAACPKVWTVLAGADTSASIEDSYLVLTGSNLAGRDLQIYQDGLEGDFRISAVFELMPGSTGPFVRIAVTDQSGVGGMGGVDSFPDIGVGVYELPTNQTGGLAATTAVPAGAEIRRTGSTLDVRAGTPETGRSISVPNFTTGPARVWFFLGSSGTSAPATTARIGELNVFSGTGIEPDTFDCDSLIH
jgi:hypothetical protein